MIQWILFTVIVIHGLIHAMGGLNEFGWATFEEMSGETLIPLTPFLKKFVGAIWFVGVGLFLLSGALLVLNQSLWIVAIIFSLMLSQFLIILYWKDAKYGTIANILIITGMFFV